MDYTDTEYLCAQREKCSVRRQNLQVISYWYSVPLCRPLRRRRKPCAYAVKIYTGPVKLEKKSLSPILRGTLHTGPIPKKVCPTWNGPLVAYYI